MNEAPPGPDPAEVASTERLVILIWAGLFFALAVFSAAPGLDLLFSARYFREGEGFFLRNDPVVLALYDWTPWIGRGLVLLMALFAMLAPLIARWALARGRPHLAEQSMGRWRHVATLVVCSALLGNGLLIEGVFKAFVGRPRPVQTVEFGGKDAYVRPFRTGPDASHHRSFVTSHGAAGFALISLGLSCGPVWRRRWLLIGIVAGGAIGLGRIMQGGHFLSDVVFAFYSVWLSCELVAWLDRKRQARQAPPQPKRRPSALN